MKPNLSKLVSQGMISKELPSADSSTAFFDQSGSSPPDLSEMVAYLTFDGKHFVLNTDYAHRHIPKQAGFTWDRLVPKKWVTTDPTVAAKFIRYASSETTKIILEKFREREEEIAASTAASSDIVVPAPAGLSYLPYQLAGIQYAATRAATLIADEPGLGKTIQAIGVINFDSTIKRVLVISRASLKRNWLRELKKWLVRQISVGIAEGKGLPDTDVIIINFELLGKHIHKIGNRYSLGGLDRNWDLIIVDEAHYIKESTAQRTKLTSAVARRAKHLVLLTGTPILNRPIELYSLLKVLDPKTWGKNWEYFVRRYCAGYKDRFGRWVVDGASNLDELQDKLRSTVMIRRLKRDVLTELPPKRRQVIEISVEGTIKLIEAEWKQYRRVEGLKAAVGKAKESSDLEEYKKAVEALRGGERAAFVEMSSLRQQIGLRKVPLVIEHVSELVDNDPNYKVVVFAHHREIVEKITEEFGDRAVKLYGGMNDDEKQRSIDRFQTDPHVQVFVGSIQAAGVGITLTASSHVIFAELDWVPANITQAEDRVHRIGQEMPVLIQHLVLEGSLDATMAKTIIEKQETIDAAVDRQEEVTT